MAPCYRNTSQSNVTWVRVFIPWSSNSMTLIPTKKKKKKKKSLLMILCVHRKMINLKNLDPCDLGRSVWWRVTWFTFVTSSTLLLMIFQSVFKYCYHLFTPSCLIWQKTQNCFQYQWFFYAILYLSTEKIQRCLRSLIRRKLVILASFDHEMNSAPSLSTRRSAII